ncbi:Zinc knuckle CX2CX4HX4C [Sesbania bispinosa]|nr:Zinc knuckle CX2CX4HX4C [Sesbania bispinosa]
MKMGYKVGTCLGNVVESDVFEERDRGTFLKVMVEIDISKPLLPGIPVGSHKDGVTWVDFQYERLPQFCYWCGRVGHNEDMCKDSNIDLRDNSSGRKDFGPWMRASHFGRKSQQHKAASPLHDVPKVPPGFGSTTDTEQVEASPSATLHDQCIAPKAALHTADTSHDKENQDLEADVSGR